MNDHDDFDDWSHPTPVLMKIPRRRRRINWWRIFGGFVFLGSAALSIWAIYRVWDAYRVINE